ncbi:MAG: restriction endonuclease subunit S [Paenibacillaceae bacterium]
MMKDTFKRYGNYKDSEVPWLGNIPNQWDVKRLKDIGYSIIGITYSPEDILDEGIFGVLVLRSSNIQNNKLSLLDNVYVRININRKQTLRKGDILLCSRNGSPALIGKNICIDERTEGQTFGAFMTVYRSRYYRFIQNFFNSKLFESQSGLYMSSTINQLTINTLNNFLITLPGTEEQKAIADYLDNKTAKIDRKIDLLTQKATQYGKFKQSLINESVTCGLDKYVTMKDSGVEWIGSVPKHWSIERIGTAFEERREIVNDTDYSPLSVTMKGIVSQLDSAAKTDHNDNRKRVVINDFVINSRSDRRGSSGVSELNGSVSVINIVLAPRKNFFGKYLHHLFRSYRFIEEFYRVGRGIVDDLWTTRYSVMKAIDFAYPDLKEQQAIADYLDTKTAHIDRIVETINTQIDKLKELRKTLINDVVTGKIKVFEEGEAV